MPLKACPTKKWQSNSSKNVCKKLALPIRSGWLLGAEKAVLI